MIKIKSNKFIVGESLFDGYLYASNGKIVEITKEDKPCEESYDYTGKYVSAGFIERETHKNTTWQQARFECCHHKWCDLSETGGGIAIINDGKYGASFEENTIGLSLLRATIRPDVTSDMGMHNFCYMIMPHAGDAVSAGINNLAFQYNVPLARYDGEWTLPTFEPLYLQSAKKSEDGEMTVIRLSEQDGTRGQIKLDRRVKILDMLERVQGETDVIEYKPFEIITIGI